MFEKEINLKKYIMRSYILIWIVLFLNEYFRVWDNVEIEIKKILVICINLNLKMEDKSLIDFEIFYV